MSPSPEIVRCPADLFSFHDRSPHLPLTTEFADTVIVMPTIRPTNTKIVHNCRKTFFKEDSRIIQAGAAKKAAPARTTETKTPAKPEPAPVAVPSGFCDALPEHGIALNVEKLKSVGYVAAEQVTVGTGKGYKLYKADGTSKVMLPAVMKLTGFATAATVAPAPAPSADIEDDGALWPEDAGYAFNLDVVKKAGYAKVAKCTKNGKQMYALVKASGEQRVVSFSNMKLLGYVKKV